MDCGLLCIAFCLSACLTGFVRPMLGCPFRTKVWSWTFPFAPKLILDRNNSRNFFQNFLTPGSFTPMLSKFPLYCYITEIFDGTEIKDLEVKKFFFWSYSGQESTLGQTGGWIPNFCYRRIVTQLKSFTARGWMIAESKNSENLFLTYSRQLLLMDDPLYGKFWYVSY